ncbi:hypothetical protein [Streptomyces antibioticus]|uniref:hypothetical protein n=1 Tax=Streptomyces antibioticus TaxID=1890 RepID=UPI0033BD8400
MRRTTIAALAIACLTLTACTATEPTDNKPTPAASTTTASVPAADPAQARQACVDAWADTIAARPADWDDETDEDPEPTACKGLPADDYTDMYFEGLQQANQQAREAFDACTDDPTTCTP